MIVLFIICKKLKRKEAKESKRLKARTEAYAIWGFDILG